MGPLQGAVEHSTTFNVLILLAIIYGLLAMGCVVTCVLNTLLETRRDGPLPVVDGNREENMQQVLIALAVSGVVWGICWVVGTVVDHAWQGH